MEQNIIQFPRHNDADLDPVQQRAQFFFDLDMAEMTMTIPQAQPAESKAVY